MTEPVNPSPFETIKDPAPQAGTGLTTALTASVTHVLEDKLEEWPSSAVYSKATRLVLIQIEAKRAAGWSLMIGAMSLIACALLAFVSMPRDLKVELYSRWAVWGAVSAWVYSQSRDPKRYSRVVLGSLVGCQPRRAWSWPMRWVSFHRCQSRQI